MNHSSRRAEARRRIYLPWCVDVVALRELVDRPPLNHLACVSVYGCLRGATPSGRPNDFVPSSREEIERLVRHCNQIGVATTYLLNGLGGDRSAWPDELLNWLCKSLRPSAICLTEPHLAHRLVEIWPDVCIEVSTIAACLEAPQASAFLDDPGIGPHVKALCLHHDATSHNWQRTAALTSWLLKRRIDPFVLVNESCTALCLDRESHYRFFGARAGMRCTDDFIDPYQVGCVLRRLIQPWTLLDLAGFLQPSMLPAFTKVTGIQSFKLAGRSMPWEWIANAFRHYAAGQDPANIFEIVVFTVPFLDRWQMTSPDLFYVDSSAYLEVHADLVRLTSSTERCAFLKAEAVRLFEKGQLRVGDPGSEYRVQEGNVVLVKPGEYASCLHAMRAKSAN